MVELCAECDEPATCFAVVGGGQVQNRVPYCYRHAASAGLASPIPDRLLAAAEAAGCSANAVLCLLEVLRSRPEALQGAAACCIALWDAARQRFGPHGERVLGCWRVADGSRLTTAVRSLVDAGLVELNLEVAERVYDGLRVAGPIPIS